MANRGFKIFKKVLVLLSQLFYKFAYYFLPYRFRPVKDLTGDVVLITGSGNGLGRQLAARLANHNVKLVLWDNDKNSLEETRRLLEETSPDVTVRYDVVDVCDRRAVYEAAIEVKGQVGPVDLLINCTDAVNGERFVELNDEKILKSFDTNALSQVWVVKAFLPDMMERRRGHLVAVPCVSGLVGAGRLTDYCASQYAVVGFIESLRSELSLEGFDNQILTTLVFPYSTNNQVLRKIYDGLVTRLDDVQMAEEVIAAIRRGDMVHYVPETMSWVLMLKPFLPGKAIVALQRLLNGPNGDRVDKKRSATNQSKYNWVFNNTH